MNEWLTVLSDLQQRAESGVLITIVQTRGSAPRDAGTKMVVTPDAAAGTIGGGQLEFKAIEEARDMLGNGQTYRNMLKRFPLGPSLGQCCGGVVSVLFEHIDAGDSDWIERLVQLQHKHEPLIMVTQIANTEQDGSGEDQNRKMLLTATDCVGHLNDSVQQELATTIGRAMLGGTAPVNTEYRSSLLFEPVTSSDLRIVLFGAGHVGKALVKLLADMPCRILWIDSRADQFPSQTSSNTTVVVSEEPEYELDHVPAGACILVMTHSHALDQTICERALRRDVFSYCGLIGSTAKRRKFEKRLLARGLSARALDSLTCPIGIDGITGKHPSQIAVSVAAQLLLVHRRIGVAANYTPAVA